MLAAPSLRLAVLSLRRPRLKERRQMVQESALRDPGLLQALAVSKRRQPELLQALHLLRQQECFMQVVSLRGRAKGAKGGALRVLRQCFKLRGPPRMRSQLQGLHVGGQPGVGLLQHLPARQGFVLTCQLAAQVAETGTFQILCFAGIVGGREKILTAPCMRRRKLRNQMLRQLGRLRRLATRRQKRALSRSQLRTAVGIPARSE